MLMRRYAKIAAEAAEDKKADDVQILDIRKESDVADFVVIAGVNSSAQMKAVRDGVKDALEQKGLYPIHQEGQSSGRWIVLDYGGMVIHVLLPQARHFYRLESLWEKAKPIKRNHK